MDTLLLMKELIFIRHAESVSNAGGPTMPHGAVPLSELGLQQAQILARLIEVKPATVLVSRFLRTHQTAAPFCERFGVQPQVHPDLHEFSVIDPALIQGLLGPQRKPFVKAYWDDPDPLRRLGENADTFAEFDGRVSVFIEQMDQLPDSTVIFGHGIWIALMFWRLLGYEVTNAEGMKAFRRFQLALPMPNCAVFSLVPIGERWSVRAKKVRVE